MAASLRLRSSKSLGRGGSQKRYSGPSSAKARNVAKGLAAPSVDGPAKPIAAAGLTSTSTSAYPRRGTKIDAHPPMTRPPDFPQFSAKTWDTLRGFDSRLEAHAGYQEHVRLMAFSHSLHSVFERNRQELLAPLLAASSSWDVAMKLLPGVDDQAREEVVAEVTQRLHNYAAGTTTLVDHSRRLLRARSGAVVDEFGRQLAIVLENPEIVFVQNLRNFMLHRSLPLIAHRLRLSGGEAEATHGSSDLLLRTADLLRWDNWSRASRDWLESQTEDVTLRPLIAKHGQMMYELNVWLL